jgi:hypothetical protein
MSSAPTPIPARAPLAPTERTEIRLYTAAVLRQVPEEPLQPVPMGTVLPGDGGGRAAGAAHGHLPRRGARTGIPVGVYRAGGTEAAIYLDADFLLGPEAAHLSISGVSGLATKTSAVEWLLASIFAHFPAPKGSVAAVCFNVKGPDLCFLDQPASTLSDADRDDVRDPRRAGGAVPERALLRALQGEGPRSSRRCAPTTRCRHNVSPLTWGLREVLQYAEVLLNKDDVDAKADALIDFIKERVLDQPFSDPAPRARAVEVRSFTELEQWFRELLRAMEGRNADVWRTHHVATIRKVRNRLTNISTRCKGLVTDDGHGERPPVRELRGPGGVRGRRREPRGGRAGPRSSRASSRKLREHLEKRRALGVDHLVVFVDELNKYAPADGPETYVRKMLLDIAERGRYLGLVLFSAQQFRSQVHRRVVGNSGTAIYGRMDPDELATPGYAVIGPSTRTKLATLDKGQLMVRHPHFAQPIFVRFPRPAVLSGREGAERFPQGEEQTLEQAVTKSLRRLDPSITLGWMQDVLALAGDDEDGVLRARNRTLQARPDDVKAFFKAQLRKRATPEVSGRRGPPALRVPASDDPYG